jgi:hypothetical protein
LEAISAAIPRDRVSRLAGRAWTGTPVFLTFDDGGASALHPTADLLERRGWSGHFFVTTRRIGTPGFLDFWQLHYSENAPRETNSPDQFIANVESNQTNHPAYSFKLSARMDGSFTMTNQRTGFSREYPAAGRTVAGRRPR